MVECLWRSEIAGSKLVVAELLWLSLLAVLLVLLFPPNRTFFLFFLGFVYIRRPFHMLPYVLAGVLVQVQVFGVLFL